MKDGAASGGNREEGRDRQVEGDEVIAQWIESLTGRWLHLCKVEAKAQLNLRQTELVLHWFPQPARWQVHLSPI